MCSLNFWRRLLAAAVLAKASVAAVKSEDKSALTDAEKVLAKKYAAIEAWDGYFSAEETAGYHGTAGGFYRINAASYEKSSRASFRLARLKDDNGQWDPARGMFEWRGDGTLTAANDEQKEQWMKRGDGFASRTQSGGMAALTDMSFNVWLHERSVTFGVGAMANYFTETTKGRVVESVSENSRVVQKTRSLNKTTPNAGGAVMPLRGLGLPGQKQKPAVLAPTVMAGPGVLVFTQNGPVATSGWTDNYSGFYRSRVVLAPIYEDVEVEVTIKGYEKWEPKGAIAKPELPGRTLDVKAVLIPKTARAAAAPPKVKSFQFFLEDVSREPGVCMNWPRFGADGDAPPEKDAKPDLRFNLSGGATLSDEDLKAELAAHEEKTDGKVLQTATAQVDSYDFGGYATLRVICVLQDGRELAGILKQGGDRLALIPVPWRTQGSRIAQAWKDRVKLGGSDRDDLDPEPVGDGNLGDGFSNYEEYRGFAQRGDHVRTKPGRKDLFVRNTIGTRALPGIFRYADITGISVHYELRASEMPKSRRMNANRSADSPRSCAADQFQHGLILQAKTGGDASITDIDGDLWRPQFVTAVNVLADIFDPDRGEEPASTVAHELSHATGVRHHGEADDYVAWMRKTRVVGGVTEAWFEERPARYDDASGGVVFPSTPGQRIRIFDRNGNEVSSAVPGLFDQAQTVFLGRYHQQHSGDVNCVMRYIVATGFVLPGRPRDRFISPGEPVGLGLCVSANGTEFNAPNAPPLGAARYAIASMGNCAHQVCVRDDAPPPEVKP